MRSAGSVAGGAVLALLTVIAAAGPHLAPRDPRAIDFAHRLHGPSLRYPLGTDAFGRCVLSRLLHGARATFGTSVAMTIFMVAVALAAAALSTLGPQLVRTPFNHIVEIVAALPSTAVAVAVVAILRPGLASAAIALAATRWALPSRTLIGAIRAEQAREHVLVARAMGATRRRIARREVLPAVVDTLALVSAQLLAFSVLNLSALSFVGLGAQPPAPEWGAMLNDARQLYFTEPWLLLGPALALTATISAAHGVARAFTQEQP